MLLPLPLSHNSPSNMFISKRKKKKWCHLWLNFYMELKPTISWPQINQSTEVCLPLRFCSTYMISLYTFCFTYLQKYRWPENFVANDCLTVITAHMTIKKTLLAVFQVQCNMEMKQAERYSTSKGINDHRAGPDVSRLMLLLSRWKLCSHQGWIS